MKLIPLSRGKVCNHCKELKPVQEFSRLSKSGDGYQPRCKSCHNKYRIESADHIREYQREYQKRRPEVARAASKKYRLGNLEKVRQSGRNYMRRMRKEKPEQVHANDRKLALSKNYGITETEYTLMMENQGGVCAICGGLGMGKRKYLCVDHDHASRNIRGLLCHRCNSALGLVADSTDILQKMIAYLDKNARPNPV